MGILRIFYVYCNHLSIIPQYSPLWLLLVLLLQRAVSDNQTREKKANQQLSKHWYNIAKTTHNRWIQYIRKKHLRRFENKLWYFWTIIAIEDFLGYLVHIYNRWVTIKLKRSTFKSFKLYTHNGENHRSLSLFARELFKK
jgi:hypothetical protein